MFGTRIRLMAEFHSGVGLAAVMTAGALVGYYLASHYSQRIPQARVRQIITAIGFIISGATFYTEFIR